MGQCILQNQTGGGTWLTGVGCCTTGNNQTKESSILDSKNKVVTYILSAGAYVSGNASSSAKLYGSNNKSSWSEVASLSGWANTTHNKTGTLQSYRYYKCICKSGPLQNSSSASVFIN